MFLTKQIKRINKAHLTNAAHHSFHTEVLARMDNIVTEIIDIEALVGHYRLSIEQEALCIARVSQNALTQQLIEKYHECERISRFIYALLRVYARCPMPTERFAARRIITLLPANPYIYELSRIEETAVLNSQLNALLKPSLASDLQLIGLTPYVKQLNEQNNIFHSLNLAACSTHTYATSVPAEITAVRRNSDEVLDAIVLRVNTQSILNPSKTQNAFIDTINYIFDKY